VTDTGPVYATIVNKAFSSPADSARARVSTYEQNLQLQVALKKAGCKRVFTDKEGGTRPERKGLAKALSHLRENDALVVWKLDRLGQNGERAGSGTHSMSRSSISNLHYF
jgi:DNA invertase Pin-like site-specific DNA recombinase